MTFLSFSDIIVIRIVFLHYYCTLLGGCKMEVKCESPLVVYLSDKRYSLRVDLSSSHRQKQAPHWHLYRDNLPIARITNYGVWTSFPIGLSLDIRSEVEKITSAHLREIALACGQTTINDATTYRRYRLYSFASGL